MKLKDGRVDDIIEVLEIKDRFLKNNNIDAGYYVYMKEIMEFFNIDRIYIGMKSMVKNKCVPIVEYIKGQEPNFLGDVKDFGSYAKFVDISMSELEQEFMKFADNSNHFLENDFNKLSDILLHLGYVSSSKGNPKECLIFYIKTNESFSFMFMERYEKYEEPFSKVEKLALADIYNTLRTRISKETLEERLYNEIYMKNIILENEQMPMCMVKKEDSTVIYFNEDYKKFVPNIELNANYYNLFPKEQNIELITNSETLILQNYIENQEEVVKYFIKKVMLFKLADKTEVYMIYIKDTLDYIRQLEGIDLLTSAYSMKGFSECFKKLVTNNIDQDYVLCTLDIAKFKYINDSLGFHTGNKLLKKIADVLNKFIRVQEAFCRMNDDKFAFIIQCNTKDEIIARVNGLFEKLEIMRNEYFMDITITYIVGVTNVEKDLEVNILMDRANMARKTAKGSHKNSISFFDEEAEQKLRDEMTIETRVSKAVDNGEFIPYLQPKFNLKTMEICGAEALVRWITPTGMIFPDSFIPLFEKNGFINTLDFIIYQKVMEHIRSCLDRGFEVYPISLNVSRNHIQNKNFVNQIIELMEKYKVPVELLELEITESIFVEDREKLKYFIDNIKRPKIKVSIDDFGTAYSSLQILKDIDIDILKIDRGFLENIDFSDKHKFTKDEVVLKNIINLARDLNCKVICEGIETENQIELLKNIGCEYGQGYVFAKPMPIVEYENKFLINV